jgi:hypothetical protein
LSGVVVVGTVAKTVVEGPVVVVVVAAFVVVVAAIGVGL